MYIVGFPIKEIHHYFRYKDTDRLKSPWDFIHRQMLHLRPSNFFALFVTF